LKDEIVSHQNSQFDKQKIITNSRPCTKKFLEKILVCSLKYDFFVCSLKNEKTRKNCFVCSFRKKFVCSYRQFTLNKKVLKKAKVKKNKKKN